MRLSMHRLGSLARRAALVAALAATPAATAAAKDGPPQRSIVAALAYSTAFNGGTLDPPGANRWDCKPTAAHPRPVILVHGTGANAYDDWAYLAPRLAAAGACVFALNYSTTDLPLGPNFYALGPIADSAEELAAYVDKVLAATGAKQVDLVGHSQGGMMPRKYLKDDGGTDPADPSKNKVHALVSIAATNSGTSLSGLFTLAQGLGITPLVRGALGQAAVDQYTNSPFIRDLNAGGMTQPGVVYTAIATRYDEVVTPYTNAYISDNPAGAEVHNILLQRGCPTNLAEHLSIPYSARTLWFVKDALGLPHSAQPTCDVQLPVV